MSDLEELNFTFAPDSFEGFDSTENRSELSIRGVTYDSAPKTVGIIFENGEKASQTLVDDGAIEDGNVYKAAELPDEWIHNGISHVMLISNPTRDESKVFVISADLSKYLVVHMDYD